MKKFLVIIVIFTALLFWAAPRFLGFSLLALDDVSDVATGLGAKLACSGYFVSGFDPEQASSDVSSYSPAAAILDTQFDDQQQRVTSSLLGMASTSATYRQGLGCTLDIGNTSALDALQSPPIMQIDSPWPTGSATPDIDANLQATLDSIVAEDNAAGLHTRAMAVIKDGKLIAESYGDGSNSSTKLLGWSMGKSVTAMLIGRLDALNSVDAQQTKLFGEWQDARRDISLENMLQMSSGLEFDETYAPGSDSTKMLFTANSAAGVALGSPLLHAPGSHNSYSSGTTNLLSLWLYRQLNSDSQALVEFTRNQLFEPLGMANTVFELDPSGVQVGSSYIYANARDWARLGQLMLNNGEWQGEQLLRPEWVMAAKQPNTSDNEKAYGYQFWLNRGDEQLRWPTLPADAYAMMGNRAQSVMILPSQKVVLVRLGWTAGNYPMEQHYERLLQEL